MRYLLSLYSLIIFLSINAKYYTPNQLTLMLDNLTTTNKALLEKLINIEYEEFDDTKSFRASTWIIKNLKTLLAKKIMFKHLSDDYSTAQYISSMKYRMANLSLNSIQDDFEELRTEQVLLQLEQALDGNLDLKNYFMNVALENNTSIDLIEKQYNKGDVNERLKVGTLILDYIKKYEDSSESDDDDMDTIVLKS